MLSRLFLKQSWPKYLILLVSMHLMDAAELRGEGLSITEPLDYQVFQRRSQAKGEVRIRGLMDEAPGVSRRSMASDGNSPKILSPVRVATAAAFSLR